MTRVRQTWAAVKSACRDGWNKPRPGGCLLPDECEHCYRWVCNACEAVVSWSNGGNGDGDLLCDACWCRFIKDWLDAEERLEVGRMKQYEGACAL